MAIREGIKSQFGDLGFEVSENVLDKCVEICVLHNVDEETFVETWTAFSVTNLGGEPPTEETLIKMERQEFLNQDKVSSTNTPNSCKTGCSLSVQKNTSNSNQKLGKENFIHQNTTPKGTKNNLSRQLSFPVNRNSSLFSPASFSPLPNNPSGSYSTRTNAGEVVFDFAERAAATWKGKERIVLNINSYMNEVLSPKQKIMLEPLSEKAAVLNDVIHRIGSHLLELNGLQEPSYVRHISSSEVVCVGRICCDSNDHLNVNSVVLEGSRELCTGHIVPLDLSALTNYALFPGQVVAAVGVNPTGNKLIVKKLFSSAILPSPLSLPRFSAPLQIVIASGPFTQSDSLAYEPLEDLMKYVKSHKPHLLILIGPVVDLRQIQHTSDTIAETYNSLFERIIKSLVDQLQGSWTEVVVVSSANDAVCLPVFPTPPPLSVCNPPRIHLVPDPSLLSINGLVLGVTATDTLMHLGKEEISFPPSGSDRLGRLASHLLHQQSFYPLYPPTDDTILDAELWDSHASLSVTPHILIVPSNFRYFIKYLSGCLMVNPEHLAKGTGGGTFARMEVEPPTDDDIWSPNTHVSAQILKI